MTTLTIANKNYSSWSLRPWLLMTELGLAFEEKLLPFGDTAAWHEYRAQGGSGKVPALQDGDLHLWDSLAITEYLAEQHPGVWPAAPAARAWARSVCAEMHSGFPALRAYCSMNISVRVKLETMPEDLAQDLERIAAIWLEGLNRFDGPFLAGERFSAVDAFFAPVVFRFETYNLDRTPAMADYIRRMLALPGMQSWASAALQEPWIDPVHENECEQLGRIVSDPRSPS